MDTGALKAAATKKFEELQAEREKLAGRTNEVDQELNRLQGEYRAYELIEESLPKDTQADPATTIKAEEKTNGKRK